MASVLRYHSILIDSSYDHLLTAVKACLTSTDDDVAACNAELESLWKNEANPNHVLPCLCVRTGLDLFLQAEAYPPGSEIIMTAINIQDMAQVIRNQGLKVVSLDLCIDTLQPKLDVLERLITPRTKAVLIAHLYGKWIDLDPVIVIAQRYGLHIIEDCAECFCGFSHLGHVKSDVSLFSFGVIKFSTSFGGAIVKVRDRDVYNRMKHMQSRFPCQSNRTYLRKVVKYFVVYALFYTWPSPHLHQILCMCGLDLKDFFTHFLRGFPAELIKNIRHRPSPALLSVMLQTHKMFDLSTFGLSRVKGDYFTSKLTDSMYPVGMNANINNFWLFPVLVKYPEKTLKCLNSMGLGAYRGSTQLSIIEGDKDLGSKERDRYYPHEARYLIDHVLYLPISKLVPFPVLDDMLAICNKVMRRLEAKGQGCNKMSSVPVGALKAKL